MRVHVLAAGDEGKLTEVPMTEPLVPYTFTEMALALFAEVPPFT
jgi:hypothetical protein